ncbi:MAG: DUF1007 family protein [Deltaproteobacteria bacterium]|nr:DUF1007 family protein [Deltaproteobacteria bacterium]
MGLLLTAVLSCRGEVSAHPHVFVSQRFVVIFDDQGLAGVQVCWAFDDMFSTMIAGDYDLNQNGRFEGGEIAKIEKEAFSNLAGFGYFLFIRIDRTPFPVKYVKDFNAILDKGKMSYEFFVPCHVQATSQFKKLSIAGYDPSYYTAMFFSEQDPVVLRSAEGFEVRTALREDPETSIYFDMIHPQTLFLEFRRQP